MERKGEYQTDGLFGVECQAPNCMAWRSAVPEEKMEGKSWDALVDLVAIQEGYSRDLAEAFCKDRAKGYCKLIDRPSLVE